MDTTRMLRHSSALLVAALGAHTASAQVGNLRITEISPTTSVVEVTNTGPAFVAPAVHPFCHRFNYMSVIPSATPFAAGQIQTFPLTNLVVGDTDFWLYVDMSFGNSNSMVHGLKWGMQPNIGRTALAVSRVPPLWTSASQYAPAPIAGQTLAWDGFGVSPFDWYLDETPTLGAPDSTPFGIVANDILASGGTQTFENMSLGDTIDAIADWIAVDASAPGMFTVRAVNDHAGVIAPRSGVAIVHHEMTRQPTVNSVGVMSHRWLRIRDQDAGNVQNRFYSAAVTAPGLASYTWTYYINLEETPPAPAALSRPRLLIQHALSGGGFSNAWGIELNSNGGLLVVTGVGGPAASAPLFPLSGATAVGSWIRVDLSVDFVAGTVAASINSGAPVSLAITPDANVLLDQFRFCYRGEGAGNINTMLLDDLSVAVTTPPPPHCNGNANADSIVNFDDITSILSNWLNVYGADSQPGDANNDHTVNFDDITSVLSNWLNPCP